MRGFKIAQAGLRQELEQAELREQSLAEQLRQLAAVGQVAEIADGVDREQQTALAARVRAASHVTSVIRHLLCSFHQNGLDLGHRQLY